MFALVRLGIFLVFLAGNGILAVAAPNSLTYQGRILKSDGTPLEYSSVSFQFEITSPDGLCVVYREQVNGINMVNSGGVFDVPIGGGTQSYPGNGTFTLLDSFNNSGSLTCDGGSTYSPQFDDVRKLRVKFYDGSGWKTISPDSTVRSVPYAGFSYSAAKLGTNTASDFVLKTGIPTCVSGTFLSWDGTQLTCAGVTGASGGTVTDVTSANSYLTIVNNTSTPQLTLNVGTVANTVAAGNDPRLVNAIQSGGSASGDLSGTYPGPSVVAIRGVGVTTTTPTTGQVFKFNGTNWAPAGLTTSDISGLSSALSSYLTESNFFTYMGTANCSSSQTMYWNSVTNGFQCMAINVSLSGDVTGTIGTSKVVALQNQPVDSTAPSSNQVLQWNGAKWAPTTLPAGNAGTVTSVTGSAPITVVTGTSTPVISISQASSSANGYLSSTDWSIFNGKQPAGNYVTALTGDVTASGPGSASATVAKLQGSTLTITTPSSGEYVRYNGSAFVNSVLQASDLSGTLSASSLPAFTGDVTSSAGSTTLTLASVGTAGTYYKVTTDSKGRVTSGSASLVASDIPNLDWSKITTGKPTTLSGYGITDSLVKNGGGVANISAGLDASKPSSPTTGDLFVATDSQKIYRYNGSSWDLMSSASGSGGTITALTSDVSASGSGSVAATVNSVGGSTAAQIHSAEVAANAATNSNTASALVKRDASGNFSAGTITANLTGSASLNVLKAGDSMTGSLNFAANTGNVFTAGSGANTATVEGPSAAITTSYVLRLPTVQGSANQALVNDGSGNLSWANLSSGSLTGSGTAGYLPYYSAASTLANSAVYYNGTNVGIGTTSPISKLQIGSANATTDYGTTFMISGNAGCSNCAGSARIILEDKNASSTTLAGLGFGGNSFAIGSLNSAGSVWNNTAIFSVNTSTYLSSFTGNVSHAANTGDVYIAGSGSNTVTVEGPSAAVTTSYVLRLPTAQGSANQVMINDGSGNLSWSSLSSLGVTSVAVTSPITNSGTASAPNIGIQQATTSQSGYLSSTDWNAFNNKQSTTLNSGNIFVGNGSNVATAVVPSADVSMTNGGAFTVVGLRGKNVSSTLPTTAGQVLRYDGTTWTPNFVSMFDLRSTVTGTQAFGGVGCTAGQTLTWTAATDNLSCSSIAITGSQVTYASQAANTVFAAPSGSAGTPTFRNLVAADLPTSGVSANTYRSVTVDAYGRVTAGTNPTTASGYGITDAFVTGGNSFGAAANLGTNDNYALNFKTNNTTWMTLLGTGKLGIGTTTPGSLNSTDALTIYKTNTSTGATIVSDNTSTNTARYPSIMVMNYMGSPGTGSGGNPAFNMLNSRGTSSSPAAMKSGESLGAFVFNGSSDTSGNYIEGAAIWAMTTQAYSSSAAGTQLQFYTTANNTTTAVPRVTIDQSGYVGVGNQSPVSMLQIGGSALSQASWTTQGSHFYIPGVTSTDTSGSGTISSRTVASIGTHTFAASSTETITNASTMYIAGAPSAGTNVTITNPLSLHVGAGNTALMGNVGIGITGPAALLHLANGTSASSWGSNGIAIRESAATYTDTSSSGTVATNFVNNIGQPTLAASSATTYTTAATFEIAGAPIAGSNVTIATPQAFSVLAGNSYFGGNVGVGTTSPSSSLTVAGTIESTSGGVKFPDGTTQATAAPTAVGFYAYGSAQSVTTGTTTVVVNPTVAYDKTSAYSASTGLFTIPASAAGTYSCTCVTDYEISGGSTTTAVDVFTGFSGTAASYLPDIGNRLGCTQNACSPSTTATFYTTGGTVGCTTYQNSGSSRAISGTRRTYFTCARVSN